MPDASSLYATMDRMAAVRTVGTASGLIPAASAGTAPPGQPAPRAELFHSMLTAIAAAAGSGAASVVPFNPSREPAERPAAAEIAARARDPILDDASEDAANTVASAELVVAPVDPRPLPAAATVEPHAVGDAHDRPNAAPAADAEAAPRPATPSASAGRDVAVAPSDQAVATFSPTPTLTDEGPAISLPPPPSAPVTPGSAGSGPAAQQAAELARVAPSGTRLDVRVDIAGANESAAKALTPSPSGAGGASSGGVGTDAGRTPGQPVQPLVVSAPQPQAVGDAGVPGQPTLSATAAQTGAAGTAPRAADAIARQGLVIAAAADATIEPAAGEAHAGGATAPVVRAGDTLAATTPRIAAGRAISQQVAVHINHAVGRGLDHIEIELRPETLGRIEVRLDVDRDGHVNAVILADHADALDLLRADAKMLERAMQDAGLKTDGSSLNFGLRDEASSGGQRTPLTPHDPSTRKASESDDGAPLTADPAASRRRLPGDQRIDVRA